MKQINMLNNFHLHLKKCFYLDISFIHNFPSLIISKINFQRNNTFEMNVALKALSINSYFKNSSARRINERIVLFHLALSIV